jgi:SNF2 family DNA or RNA helicase
MTTPTLQRVRSAQPWKPHKYQGSAVRFLIERAEAGLFLDPGLGKTSITLGAIKILMGKKMVRRTLVLAPLRVAQTVWPEEVKKWKDFEHLRVVVLHGPDKDDHLKKDADIYVMNYEGLDWLLGAHVVVKKKWVTLDGVRQQIDAPETHYTLENFKKLGAEILVLDESTRVKHSSTQKFKGLRQVLGKFHRRWILTGTPAPNGLLDLFGQCYCMDQGKALGQFISHYRSRYFMQVAGDQFNWYPQPGAQEKIYTALAPYVLRLDAKDYLELPELLENDIYLDLPPKVRKFYDELELDFIAKTESGEIFTAPSSGVAMMRCKQVANGACYKKPIVDENDDAIPYDPREWTVFHDVKIEALQELIESLQGSPLLVAYEFKHDLFRLRKALGKSAVCFDDFKSEKAVVDLVRRWNAGEIPVLLGHPASMSHGLNMQESSRNLAWFSQTHNREHYDQFNKRVLRQGNKNSHCTVHRFIMRHTVDEIAIAALRRKDKVQTALLDALKEYRLEKKTTKGKR